MIDLKSEFKHLLHVVSEYHSGKEERLTDVIYLWWKVYHLINCKLRDAKTFSEKEDVIEEFKIFSNDLNQLYDQFSGAKIYGDENSEDVDPNNPQIPMVLSNLLKMLYMERKHLETTMKALKKEKVRGKKKPKIRSMRKEKRGWIRE
jgi:hypothetical protein